MCIPIRLPSLVSLFLFFLSSFCVAEHCGAMSTSALSAACLSGRNCINFANQLCVVLGVGCLPAWLLRLQQQAFHLQKTVQQAARRLQQFDETTGISAVATAAATAAMAAARVFGGLLQPQLSSSGGEVSEPVPPPHTRETTSRTYRGRERVEGERNFANAKKKKKNKTFCRVFLPVLLSDFSAPCRFASCRPRVWALGSTALSRR